MCDALFRGHDFAFIALVAAFTTTIDVCSAGRALDDHAGSTARTAAACWLAVFITVAIAATRTTTAPGSIRRNSMNLEQVIAQAQSGAFTRAQLYGELDRRSRDLITWR